jgi:hypothetical protein
LLTELGYDRKDLQKRGRCQDAAKDSFYGAKGSFYDAKDSFYGAKDSSCAAKDSSCAAKDSIYAAAQAYIICIKQVVGTTLRQQPLVFALILVV